MSVTNNVNYFHNQLIIGPSLDLQPCSGRFRPTIIITSW